MHKTEFSFKIKVVDVTTKKPVNNAKVELAWRTGFGGIYWGKPVILTTDSEGIVEFTSSNVPAIDELGGKMKKDFLEKIYVESISVKASKYNDFFVRPSKIENIEIISIKLLDKEANNEAKEQ